MDSLGVMASPFRSVYSYSTLVNDLWGILGLSRRAVFSQGSRAAPSPIVHIFPDFAPESGYYWDFWEAIAVPVLTDLTSRPIPPGGWSSPLGRNIVDATLRAALHGTIWEKKVDFGI